MNRNLWTSDRRLYLDAAGKVVEDGDPNKATLLVAAGGTIPMDRAEALGLLTPATPEPEDRVKMKAAPPANKSKSPQEDK